MLKKTVRDGDPKKTDQEEHARSDRLKDKFKPAPTIGDARATPIIKGRPYARKDELVQRNIIPESVYLEIKDKIIAKQ